MAKKKAEPKKKSTATQKTEPKIRRAKVSELTPDNKNFNKGTQFGEGLIEKSFDKFGAGRSILIDKNDRIIAGNKSTEKFAAQGGEDVLIVEVTGDTLVAVKRTDVDLDSKQGREMALADNASAKANIEWDAETVFDTCKEFDIDNKEWGVKDEGEEFGTEFSLPSGDKSPFQQITFTLANEQSELVKQAIDEIKETEEYKYVETYGNENSNANALYLIIQQWRATRS